jgi:putative transposase
VAIGGIFGVNGQAHTEEEPTMALPKVCRVRVAGGVPAGQGLDLIRESVRMVLQELIEAEASEVIGAARYERTTTRTTSNGHRDRQRAS